MRLRSVLWALTAMTVGFVGARFLVRAPAPGPVAERPTIDASKLAFSGLDGSPVPLSQWNGNVVLLNFWATWCAPCREEMPAFQQLREKHRSRGFEVVGVAVEDLPDKVSEFRSENGIGYPLLLAGPEAPRVMRQLGNTMGVLPFSMLLDRDGKPVRSKIGVLAEKELEDWISRELR
jgi:thiol-disulfide isomerase/thioredoxin